MSKSRLSHHGTAALACAALLPLVVGRAAIALDPPFHSAEVGHWDGYSGVYCDLASDGQYAYLPNYGTEDKQPARIHIVDISDPANPFLANTFFLPPPNELASLSDIKVGDGFLFAGLDDDPSESVAIIDIRDPLNATLVTTVDIIAFRRVHNLFYDNGFLYFITPAPRVGIVDLTALDPDNPPASPITSLTWMLDDMGNSGVHDITVVDGRLYAAAWNSGLWIYDASDVANTIPTFLGSVGGTEMHSMWPTQDGRFVVAGEERDGGGIQVFEIIEGGGSLTLELRDSFSYPIAQAHSVHNQIIIGNRLYNSWYQKGLQVFDIDPMDGTLTLVSTFDTSSIEVGNWGVYPFLGDDKILLSDMTEGLYIVDITVATVICGNGGIEGSEECDDGDPDDGDGCSSTCTAETGWDCAGQPSECTEVCGDGIIVGSEECDDGNTDDTDGCSSICAVEDGCVCGGEPSVCACSPVEPPDSNNRKKNRYISFSPNNPGKSIKLEVTLTGSLPHPGLIGNSWWVQGPVPPGNPLLPPGECVALLGPQATAADIDWQSSGCTVLHATGCPVEPTSDYHVRAVAGITASDPLVVSTILQPGAKFWGDTIGFFNGVEWTPPNLVTNIDDAVAAIKTWQGGAVVAPILGSNVAHLSVADVDPGDLNLIVNVNDVFMVILAFKGEPYPFGPANPDGNCP